MENDNDALKNYRCKKKKNCKFLASSSQYVKQGLFWGTTFSARSIFSEQIGDLL